MKFSLFLNVLMELAGVLNESRLLFLKNRKLMLFAVIFPLFLHCVVYLISVSFIHSALTNLIQEFTSIPWTDPYAPESAGLFLRFSSDARLFVGSVYIFLAVYIIVYLFFSVAIVRASALTHTGKNIQIREFLVLTIRSWKQPLVTCFYITLFILAYLFLFLIALIPVLLFAHSPFDLISRGLALCILFAVFESYLAVVWHLSVVVSILEETYGIQALGKAARIAKGRKPALFLVNLSVGVLWCLGLGYGGRLSGSKYPFAANVAIGLVVVNFGFVVNMSRLVVYTVSYFHGKRVHGETEEVEFQVYMENTKTPSELLVGDSLNECSLMLYEGRVK